MSDASAWGRPGEGDRLESDRVSPTLRRLLLATVGAVVLAGAAAASLSAQTPRSSGYDVVDRSIPELQAAMASGAVTSRQLVEAYLARIAAYDKQGPALNAFITLNPNALDTAATLDRERQQKGPRGPLHGIPVVIKDNYATEDLPTTGGSAALAGFRPDRDAFMVRKLRAAGVVIIGKTNLHELAYGITTISSAGGQTLNPYALSRTPGGSSGGTGAAIAASFAAAGMGTDTCGSIRIPSANNNLFGLRGTIGLSSRDGIIPLSHTQDIGGPLTRSVTDLALMLDATVGSDPNDPVSAGGQGKIPTTYRSALVADGLRHARIGVLTSLFGSTPDDQEVATVVRRAVLAMRAAGAETPDVAVPGLDDLLANTSVINAEFKFDLQDFLAKYRNPPVHSLAEILASGKYHAAVEGVLKRAEQTTDRNAESYHQALEKRTVVQHAVLEMMRAERLDALVYPTLRRKAALIGQAQAGSNCQLSATTGLPVIAVPAGFTDDGVPVGMDVMGGPFTESTLLKLAYGYEQAVHPRRPPSSTP